MKTLSSLRSAVIRVNRWIVALTLFCLVWLIGCDGWFDEHDDDWNSGSAIFADRFDTPWEMAVTPNGRLLVTKSPGSMMSEPPVNHELMDGLTHDGDVPADNPFPNFLSHYYGRRAPQGLAFHPLIIGATQQQVAKFKTRFP